MLVAAAGADGPGPAALAGQGLCAALLGVRLGLARWWLPLNLLFPSAVAAGLALRLPPLACLAAFLLLALTFWSSYRTQVPFFLSNRRAREALAQLLPRESGFRFVDLGAGCGGVVRELARRRPDGDFTGVELAPLPYWIGRLRGRPGASRSELRRGDFWALDLGSYDVVYAYLSPAAMPRLWEKARREMRPGSLLVSNSFPVPGATADVRVSLDERGRALHAWRM